MNILKTVLKMTFAVLLTSAFISTAAVAKDSTDDRVKKIEIQTSTGEKINIAVNKDGFVFDKYKGKPVILDFFGPHCPPCLIEIPHMIQMQKENKDKVQIIGVQVQMQMSDDELNAFIKKEGINYPVVNLDYAWDLVAFVRANTGWKGQIPYKMVFDKNGVLKRQFVGMTPTETLLQYAK
jgi:thiol-disulfide isomerase/thioredoxin